MNQKARDIAGLLGFGIMIGGIGMLSVPWALIVGGCVLLVMATLGTVHARNTARDQRTEVSGRNA